jgi:hypothetical protein
LRAPAAASNVTASYLEEEVEEEDTPQVVEVLKSRRVVGALQKNAQELSPRRKISKEAHKKEVERRGGGAVGRREERGREKKRVFACLAE